jgi:hypothetical protein
MRRATRTRAMEPKLQPPPQRKLYTIHLREKHRPFVFHIQEEAHTASSCYLVCFETVSMTKQMVELIRTHYAIHGDWPPTNISPEDPLDLVLPDDASPITEAMMERVPKIWILSWTSAELDEYAKQSLLNLFEICTDQTVKMYRFEYEIESLQRRLEKSLEI